MTLQEARKIIEEIHERYGIQFSDYQEERKSGEIKLVSVKLKFKIDKKDIDFSGNCDKIASK